MLIIKNEHRPLKGSLLFFYMTWSCIEGDTFCSLLCFSLCLHCGFAFASFVSLWWCFIALVGRLASHLWLIFASLCGPSVFVPLSLSVPPMADRVMQTVCRLLSRPHVATVLSGTYASTVWLIFHLHRSRTAADMLKRVRTCTHQNELTFHSNTGQLFL